MIPDLVLIRIYDDRRGETHNRHSRITEIGPKDLVGKTITGFRDLKTKGENPEQIRVFDFSDGSSLVIGCEGLHDEEEIHCFLVDNKEKDKYSSAHFLLDPIYEQYRIKQ